MICKRWFREYKIEFSLFIVALILSLLPIFVSVVKTPRDFIPTLNNQFYDMRDVFVYTAGVRLGLDGNFLYKYKFYPAKAENQVLIYPALTITGLILKPLSVLIPKFYLAIGGYLLLKIIGSVLLFLAALHFFKSFNFSKRESIITTAFLLFSGGSVSIDFPGLFPEAALTIASFSLDLSFTLLAVSFTKRIVEHFNKINCLWLAAAILGVVVTHPYSLLPVLCIVIGTTTILLAKKTIKIQTSAGIFATFIPALSYCVYLYYNYYQLDALGWVKMFDGVAQFMKTPPVIVIVIYLGLQGTLVAGIS
ncbi:MAG: hypothetical protein NT141_02020 [candidate division WWE3 bacterium]|nr:hypothetical protein [candidate division WWE3 bacterium]